ncbi:putative methyl-CpG binding transcription regulator, partial [Operophtera brumata]
MNISIEKKKSECPALPKGWQREEIVRKTGLSAGKVDVYYYSPTGKKFRSKPELVRYLGDSMDLSCFDFQQGQINTMLLCKAKKARSQFDYRGVRSDASLVPPIRQTASIFKQPVTVYKTQESKVKTDLKHGTQEKPKQLFWEKRLEAIIENPGVFLNPEQPLIAAVTITKDDVRKQEERVLRARKRLQEALAA